MTAAVLFPVMRGGRSPETDAPPRFNHPVPPPHSKFCGGKGAHQQPKATVAGGRDMFWSRPPSRHLEKWHTDHGSHTRWSMHDVIYVG